MLQAIIQLSLFAAKGIIVVILVLLVLLGFFLMLARSKEKLKGHLSIKNINKKFDESKEMCLAEIADKKQFKKYLKEKKQKEKEEHKATETLQHIYVINFHGDMKASAVCPLREEINALLTIAKPQDEVFVRLESAGGLVHSYGLAAAQLMRIRAQGIALTVSVDKVAASGGYLMACIANRILAAPFAIIGSIGVIVQLPNFHKMLEEKHIDFEQLTAGEFKRTLTLFGKNTEEGREKLQQEIEEIHQLFKNVISEHRPQLDIQQVATGEHWLGQQALGLKLVDKIQTGDDYLLERCKDAKIYEITYEVKKPFLNKLSATANLIREKLFAFGLI